MPICKGIWRPVISTNSVLSKARSRRWEFNNVSLPSITRLSFRLFRIPGSDNSWTIIYVSSEKISSGISTLRIPLLLTFYRSGPRTNPCAVANVICLTLLPSICYTPAVCCSDNFIMGSMSCGTEKLYSKAFSTSSETVKYVSNV